MKCDECGEEVCASCGECHDCDPDAAFECIDDGEEIDVDDEDDNDDYYEEE